MKIKANVIVGVALLLNLCSHSQAPATAEHKQLAAKRTTEPIKIDGKLMKWPGRTLLQQRLYRITTHSFPEGRRGKQNRSLLSV
jgi:hypothetical protein